LWLQNFCQINLHTNEHGNFNSDKNTEKNGDKFDYASMGQTARILNENNIMVGFTFSDDSSVDLEHVKESYKDLQSIVANSELQMMDSAADANKIAKKIFALYEKLDYGFEKQILQALKFGLKSKFR